MSSLSKIVNAMGGVRTTNGWDIICCYNQEKINKIFAKKHKENKIISTAAFSGIIKLPFVGEVTFTSELKLGAPKIAFSEDVNKQCKLLMDIIGGYISMRAKDGEEKREDFPANAAVITCYAPIAAASGDWNEISNGDKPIIFKGHGSAQHIFLHFKNDEHTTFTLSAKAGHESEVKNLTVFQTGISDEYAKLLMSFFKEEVSEISYELATLKNTTSYGLIPITPKSFIFAQSGQIDESPASLNIYIQAEESGNPPGDTSPSFQPGGVKLAPIAEGYTASLIISGQFMEKMLLKGLANYSPSVYGHTSGVLTMALRVSQTIRYLGYSHGTNDYFDGISINTGNSNMYFMLKTDGLKTKTALQFSSETSTGSYAHWSSCRGEPVGVSGKIHASFNISAEKEMLFADKGKISLSVEVARGNVTPNIRNEIIRGGGWPFQIEEVNNSIGNSVAQSITGLSVSMDSINTFLATNILFPDDNYFTFKSGDKYYVPYDLIAFGMLDFNSEMEQTRLLCEAVSNFAPAKVI